MRKNSLETSAERLGIEASFKKLPEASGQEAGWYIVSIDGYQQKTWLGYTIRDALIEFESRHDKGSYL